MCATCVTQQPTNGEGLTNLSSYLPDGSSPCMFATYFTLGFACSKPGVAAISSVQRSLPSALFPMLKTLEMALQRFAKSCMCCACRYT